MSLVDYAIAGQARNDEKKAMRLQNKPAMTWFFTLPLPKGARESKTLIAHLLRDLLLFCT